jgi:signal transduction histidine kinase
MDVEDIRGLDLFAGLSDVQLAQLLAAATEVSIEPGVELFHEGTSADDWWVLLEGGIGLLRHFGREDAVVGRMDQPGRWAGGFRAWDPNGVYLATGRGVAEGRALRVPAGALRDLIGQWLPLAGHLIEGVYGTARSIEATARQRQSLITLGTLAAGLAHELNNPAAAATRAVDSLRTACETLLHALAGLADEEISPHQFTALNLLRQEVTRRSTIEDPLVVAEHEDEIASWLVDHGVEGEWSITPQLVAGGIDVEWCEKALQILNGGKALDSGLEWVASTVAVSTLLEEIKESTGRIAALVSAVRSYSQMDRASMQRVDVREGLESTLVMLGHKLRRGVTVIRDFGQDVPEIDAYPGELNQVWTNLIDNAVDAMDGHGTLRVRTACEQDTIAVDITDTGPGMAPEVAARAFEAFYTTKDVGKGTGLGLDIARRIVVQRHGGTISIDTAPGATVLRVRLPVSHNESAEN